MKFGFIFIIIFSSFFAQADLLAPARTQCMELFLTKKNTAAESFQELAFSDKLISQTDHRLWKKGFLIENGGLCASTCGVNVLQSLYQYINLNTKNFNPDRRINQLMVIAREKLGTDARDGLYLEDLAVALKEMNSSLTSYELKTEIFKPVTEWDISPPENALHIAGIMVGEKDSLHAVVLLEVDQFERKVVFADPYHPQEVLIASYREIFSEGKIQFQIELENPDRIAHFGVINEILRLQL